MINSSVLISKLSKADRKVFDQHLADHKKHLVAATEAQDEKGRQLPQNMRLRHRQEMAAAAPGEARELAKRQAQEFSQAPQLRQVALEQSRLHRKAADETLSKCFPILIPAASSLLDEYQKRDAEDRERLGVVASITPEIRNLIRGLKIACGEIEHKGMGEVPVPGSGWLLGKHIQDNGTNEPEPVVKVTPKETPESTGKPRNVLHKSPSAEREELPDFTK